METKNNTFSLGGHFFLPEGGRYFRGIMEVKEGMIVSFHEREDVPERYFFPGLVDAHVHIESSMLVPSEFARAAVVHGTIATVSDPHEIANVLGKQGIEFMIRNGKTTPFRFYFGAPSCVPSTPLETSGAVLDDHDILELLQKEEIVYLAEMMNFPGVIYDDPQVKAKLEHARSLGKPVDGHAPGLSGEQLAKYVAGGISTDHECFTLEEAREKVALGMKILIREGSAARNFETLIPLLFEMPHRVMFCSDDKHPDDLEKGHINLLIKRGLAMGYPLGDLIRACTLNPVTHYGLNCGLLRPGDPADFIEVDHPDRFNVMETYISGICVAREGKALFEGSIAERPNRFAPADLKAEDLKIAAVTHTVKVIGALDGQLVTQTLVKKLPVRNGFLETDPEADILKLVVVNRYQPAPPAVAFIHGFGLKEGALAGTVAHDSHNIILLGTDDHWILEAYRMICASQGGLAVAGSAGNLSLPLPVAGIMSDAALAVVASQYEAIDRKAREMGCVLSAPLMTLSFMALLVIPELKLGDRGLFDGNTFSFTDMFVYQ
jgi:adenine deaminase